MSRAMSPSPEAAAALARRLVANLALPAEVDREREDLQGQAVLRALQAHARYDPRGGAAWRTWILTHARFSVREELRRLDVLTRLQRARRTAYEQARAAGRPWTEPEVPTEGYDLLSIDAWKAAAAERTGEPSEHADLEPAEVPPVERWVTHAAITQALAGMDARIAHVLRRRLQNGTLQAIAAEMSLSESRINQLYCEGVVQVRLRLGIEPAPRARPAEWEGVALYVDHGWPPREIGRQCAITANAVQRRLRRAGVTLHRDPAQRRRQEAP